MAALQFDIFTRAAVGALVIVAIGSVMLQSAPSTEADEEDLLAGEWFFTITTKLDEPSPFLSFVTQTGCIASFVEVKGGWSVPMSCSGGEGHLRFSAAIDKVDGTARFEGEFSGFQIEADGILEIDSRACIETVWRRTSTVGAGFSISVSGCQERGSRGFIRCLLLNVPVPVAPMGSKDARLILLREAGLPFDQTVGCLYRGDVNVDGKINSVDAQLILQHEAGLIEQFPP